jgi:hypothetical protein
MAIKDGLGRAQWISLSGLVERSLEIRDLDLLHLEHGIGGG